MCLLFCQMPTMFVLNPPHLVGLRVFFHCRAHSLCSRLIWIDPFPAFPRLWPPTSQAVVIASWPPFPPEDILTCRHTHPPHSRASRHFQSSACLWHIIISLKLLPAPCSRQLSSHLPLPPRLPPSFPSHRLRGHLGSFWLELGSDSSNRFLVTPPRKLSRLLELSPLPRWPQRTVG